MITEKQLLREVRYMGGNENRWKLWYRSMGDEKCGEEVVEDNLISMGQLNKKRSGILGDLETFGIVNVRLYPQDMLLRQVREGMKPGAVHFVGMNNQLTRNINSAYFCIKMRDLDIRLRERKGSLQVGEVNEKVDFWRYTTRNLMQYSPLGFLIHGHGGYIDNDYHIGFGHFSEQRIGLNEFTNWLRKIKRCYGDIFVDLITCKGGEIIEEVSKRSGGSLRGLRLEGPKSMISNFLPYLSISESGKLTVKCNYLSEQKVVEKVEVGK